MWNLSWSITMTQEIILYLSLCRKFKYNIKKVSTDARLFVFNLISFNHTGSGTLFYIKIHFFLLVATIEITTWQDNPILIIKTTNNIYPFVSSLGPAYVGRMDTKFFQSQFDISSYYMYFCKYIAFSSRSHKTKI